MGAFKIKAFIAITAFIFCIDEIYASAYTFDISSSDSTALQLFGTDGGMGGFRGVYQANNSFGAFYNINNVNFNSTSSFDSNLTGALSPLEGSDGLGIGDLATPASSAGFGFPKHFSPANSLTNGILDGIGTTNSPFPSPFVNFYFYQDKIYYGGHYYCTYYWNAGQFYLFRYPQNTACPDTTGSTYSYHSVIFQLDGVDLSTIYPPPAPPVVDGLCGDAGVNDYAYTATGYTLGSTFCTSGTASPSSPSFPNQGEVVYWSCLGSGSGSTNDSCSAFRDPAPTVNGTCGGSAITYSASDTSFVGSFCSNGTASPSSPSFPANGATTTWTCDGSGGGYNTTCNAFRQNVSVVVGACGVSAQTYIDGITTFAGTFCTSGTASPSSPSFPSSGSSVNWSCIGSGGGLSPICTATSLSPTFTEKYSWFSLDDLIQAINTFKDFIVNLFHFAFDWIGFTIDISQIYKYVSVNFETLKIVPNHDTCSNMISTDIVYWHRNAIGASATFVNTYAGLSTYLDFLPDRGTFSYTSETNSQTVAVQKTKDQPSRFSNVATTDNSGFNDSLTTMKRFTYISGTGSDMITINTGIFDNMDFVPFHLVVLNIVVEDKLNYLIRGLFGIITGMISIPVQGINILMEWYSLINMDISSMDRFCYATMDVKKFDDMSSGTRLNSVLNEINSDSNSIIHYSTQNGGILLYYLVFCCCSVVSARRMYKLVKS